MEGKSHLPHSGQASRLAPLGGTRLEAGEVPFYPRFLPGHPAAFCISLCC